MEMRGKIEIYFLCCWTIISAFLFVYQGIQLIRAYTRFRGKADDYASAPSQPEVPPADYTDEYWSLDLETNVEVKASGTLDNLHLDSAISTNLPRSITLPMNGRTTATRRHRKFQNAQIPKPSSRRPVVTTENVIEWIEKAKKTKWMTRELPGWTSIQSSLNYRNFVSCKRHTRCVCFELICI